VHDPDRYVLPRRKSLIDNKLTSLDELNTLNFKLFPVYPAPSHVKAYDVPLFTVRFETFMDENWDLTLQRVGSLPETICKALTDRPRPDYPIHKRSKQRPDHFYSRRR
jgi:hypothetical protein